MPMALGVLAPASTGSDVGGRDVGEADPAGVGLDLDQRLEPEHPAGPVAHDVAPAASKAAATSSAPTETAAASPGTKTRVLSGAVIASPP